MEKEKEEEKEEVETSNPIEIEVKCGKLEVERKTRQVHILVSQTEYARLLDYSKGHRTVSEYIRESILSKQKKAYFKTQELTSLLKKLTSEMNAIGKNVNQVARYANFLQENNLPYEETLNRFNVAIRNYTAMQIRFENVLKEVFKNPKKDGK